MDVLIKLLFVYLCVTVGWMHVAQSVWKYTTRSLGFLVAVLSFSCCCCLRVESPPLSPWGCPPQLGSSQSDWAMRKCPWGLVRWIRVQWGKTLLNTLGWFRSDILGQRRKGVGYERVRLVSTWRKMWVPFTWSINAGYLCWAEENIHNWKYASKVSVVILMVF